MDSIKILLVNRIINQFKNYQNNINNKIHPYIKFKIKIKINSKIKNKILLLNNIRYRKVVIKILYNNYSLIKIQEIIFTQII